MMRTARNIKMATGFSNARQERIGWRHCGDPLRKATDSSASSSARWAFSLIAVARGSFPSRRGSYLLVFVGFMVANAGLIMLALVMETSTYVCRSSERYNVWL